ncbi:DUF1707 domain-containing protein [Blastococcus sp. URHD0036]|uniref:DUF1707 SHOCT-like domain-containing protein n=1 Tax=Blastococcus sp. URHD0036 TaxID=1380356 RepID=UPI000495E3CB|nr:DUF1707 domain-containing protein [Blastococcus sp. URHD0036]
MPEPHLRAADADRTAVAELLGQHMAAGRLTVAEYEERLARAYASRTYGDLDELTTDLPPLQPARPATPPAPVPSRAAAYRAGVCGPWAAAHGAGGWGWAAWGGSRAAAWGSWLSTAVIVVGIWLVTSLASTDWIYPWPIWVIGPWGVVLLAQTLTEGRGDRDRERRLHS